MWKQIIDNSYYLLKISIFGIIRDVEIIILEVL